MEKIIDNGLKAVRVGLDDYEIAQKTNDDARLASAVRNVYAGILILAKGKLYELSPPETPGILIHVLRPKLENRRIKLKPVDRQTIGYEEIKKRFKHFNLALDWSGIDRIRKIRNDLEHFYHQGPKATVQEALADALVAIRRLLALLCLDPVNDLGEKYWAILLSNEELFKSELEVCRESYALVSWINHTAAAASEYLSCDCCHSRLIQQADRQNRSQATIHAICVACGAESNIKALMEHAVGKKYFHELYETQTRGGRPPVVRCSYCRHYALVVKENECAACGNTLASDTSWCEICDNPLSPEEARTNTHECPAFYHD